MKSPSRWLSAGALSVLMICGSVAAADAATLALLQDGKTIAWYDTEQKRITGSVDLAQADAFARARAEVLSLVVEV